MATVEQSRDQIRTYYGKTLQGSDDLKTNACCAGDMLPPHLDGLLEDIVPEVLSRFYGCGAPIPPALDRCSVLDLGCGAGRDVFLAARLAGPEGRVIGIDMTPEQLDVARRNTPPQMKRYGYDPPNVDFREGRIEDLAAAGIRDDSVDVVISDCVINLSPEKRRVFEEIFRVLKPGGELYFSDVFADRRLPASWRDDIELYGECLAGAMYEEDFRRTMHRVGCHDARLLARRPITIENEAIARRVGNVNFHSVTVRAFKLDTLEDRCEDYGQVACYLGTIPSYPHRFPLDDQHVFETGKPMLVCGNTASMLTETRFAPHFRVTGDRSVHFGLFDCSSPPASGANAPTAACC